MTLNPVTHRPDLAPFAVPESSLLRDAHDARRAPADYPRHAMGVPPGVHRSGRYAVRFATHEDDLRAAQRLRFEVFNLELHEGLSQSYQTGLDSDDFDLRCHHLLVIDETAGEVVGTYRLMTSELGARDQLYTASEFDLAGIPDQVLRHGAEVGRACVAKEHRNGRVLQLLWRGIARYLDWNDKRYVFGCCSVPTLDPEQVASVSLKLAREGHLHPRYHAAVRPSLRSASSDKLVAREGATLPPLFTSYLRLGAKVCGGPASDREFCVTDYFVVLDLRDVEPRMLASLAAAGLWKSVS
jgi:putative hemolysin